MKSVLLALTLACACYASAATNTTIVASKKFLAQTSDVNATIYTPAADGMFRVTMCAIDAAHNGPIGVNTTFTDIEGSSIEISLSATGAQACAIGTAFLSGPDAISFSTNGITGSGNTFNVYVVLEKLQ